MANFCHIRHFRLILHCLQIRHFRQLRCFRRSASCNTSFKFSPHPWRFFVRFAIFVKIITLQGTLFATFAIFVNFASLQGVHLKISFYIFAKLLAIFCLIRHFRIGCISGHTWVSESKTNR